MAEIKRKIYTSACGEVEPYCYLAVPDYGHGDFQQPRGIYKVSLAIPNEDPRCKLMKQEIIAAHEQNYKAKAGEQAGAAQSRTRIRGKAPSTIKQAVLPFTEVAEDDVTVFNFKCYASYESKRDGKRIDIPLTLVDSKGHRLAEKPAVSQGSVIKVRYSLVPYYTATVGAGIKLQLEGAMIINLVEYSGNSERDNWAGEEEEDGYVAGYEGEAYDQQQVVADYGCTSEEAVAPEDDFEGLNY